MEKYELTWVNTGKPERELWLWLGVRKVCSIPADADMKLLENLVELANENIEGNILHEL